VKVIIANSYMIGQQIQNYKEKVEDITTLEEDIGAEVF
jgi:hypothetical protein